MCLSAGDTKVPEVIAVYFLIIIFTGIIILLPFLFIIDWLNEWKINPIYQSYRAKPLFSWW